MNSRHEQQIHQQFRKQQQQIAALSNMQQQQQQPGYNQFRQLMLKRDWTSDTTSSYFLRRLQTTKHTLTTTLQNQIVQRKQLMVDFVKRIVNVKLKAVASRGCPVLMPSLHAERSWFDPETKF
ncbi:hypothetical protein YC2023_040203 [Brassica napus]